MEDIWEALLLLGPTGAGKTPLGEMLAARGWAGRRCVHFDFGANLRDAVARGTPDAIVSAEDLRFLRQVLATGALLEDRDFPIAERLLRSFLARGGADPATVIVLNGLPRHVGQAQAIAAILDVRTVVSLDCSAETVLSRLETNVGGDRTHRTDDDLAAVRRKLEVFAQRTAPLVAYYRAHGARIVHLQVHTDTGAEEMWQALFDFVHEVSSGVEPRPNSGELRDGGLCQPAPRRV
jgi:adenylate kinase family enzyme